MVIQMVLGQVGEHPGVEPDVVHPVQVDGMAGHLHDDLGDSVFFHLAQDPHQIQGFRGGSGIGINLVPPPVIHRADDPCRDVRFSKNGLQQIGDGGFAVGSRDPHHLHVLRRIAVKTGPPGRTKPCGCLVPKHKGRLFQGVAGQKGPRPRFQGLFQYSRGRRP